MNFHQKARCIPLILLSFVFFLLFFVAIGVYSAKRAQRTTGDYLLAGRSVPAWLVALSAVSTNNSGYMFIGQIGYTYLNGLSSIWLMVGWIVGDLLGSLLVHGKLRANSAKRHSMSFGEVLAGWNGTHFSTVQKLVGGITVLFLTLYAAAQFKAGSKALHVLFDWDISVGAIIGAGIVFIYCMAGGIRASIWTDAAQSFVMVLAMGLLLAFAVGDAGGFGSAVQQMNAVEAGYLSLFPDGFTIGALLIIIGWFFGGFGVVGQPHVMVRFMTLDEPGQMKRVRIYYYSWFLAFYALSIGVGLLARILLPELQNTDVELALPSLSQKVMPDILVGVILAGIFSATMSTADSLIISTTASVSRDLTKKGYLHSYWGSKFTTLVITVVALFFALWGPKSVFYFVLMSWSVLAAAFGPSLVLYSLGKKLTQTELLCMIVGATAVTCFWQAMGWGGIIYEIAPGMISGFLIYAVFKLWHWKTP